MKPDRRQFIALSALSLISSPTLLLAAEPLLSLENYRGKVVMIDFWASWCLPCKRSFPWLNKINQRYKNQGLVLLGVNVDENVADAQAFLANTPANFEIIYDSKGSLASKYQLKAMPSSLVFNRDGALVARHHGFKSDLTSEYESVVTSLL